MEEHRSRLRHFLFGWPISWPMVLLILVCGVNALAGEDSGIIPFGGSHFYEWIFSTLFGGAATAVAAYTGMKQLLNEHAISLREHARRIDAAEKSVIEVHKRIDRILLREGGED